jgi:3',5'-cyclic AMP phosphodiesterase CpdA
MRTLVHISDLHFGRVDDALLDPLVDAIGAARPDVLVVSGDLTQRARTAQFRAARAFLDRLPRPQVVVPGNHDVPLYDVIRRFAAPLDRYRRYITPDLAPFHADDEIAVAGINTARSLTFKHGRINAEQVRAVTGRFAALPAGVVRVVVTHHPLDLPPAADESEVVGRAGMAMHAFAHAGVDLLLSGHLHRSHGASTAERYRIDGYSALAVHAGTTTSTRGRGEGNAFNVLRIERPRLELEVWTFDAARAAFAPTRREEFAL